MQTGYQATIFSGCGLGTRLGSNVCADEALLVTFHHRNVDASSSISWYLLYSVVNEYLTLKNLLITGFIHSLCVLRYAVVFFEVPESNMI